MITRTLGRTGLDVGILGLGTEYLLRQPSKVMGAVVDAALEHHVNYMDLLYNGPTFWNDFGPVLRPVRSEFVLGVHWGVGEVNGQLTNVRDQSECRRFFEDTLTRLGTDHADVAMLMMVDSDELWDGWAQEALVILRKLKQQGHVGHIAMSSHMPAVAMRAVQNGSIDALMYPVNMASRSIESNRDLHRLCHRENVGIIAMKPFAGGRFFQTSNDMVLNWVLAGGSSVEVKKTAGITPVNSLSYTLDQPAVATVVPGVKNVDEWLAALAYLEADADERAYGRLLDAVPTHASGECVYCNHCLPCCVGIDIGDVIRLVDRAQTGITDALRATYDALPVKASECIECEQCMPRCPYEVDIVAKLQQAVALFE